MKQNTFSFSSASANNEVVSSMPDPLPKDLRNQYFLLRHGQSTANVAGIISSSRSLMYSTKHGLTDLGREQARESAKNLITLLSDSDGKEEEEEEEVLFISSPFARAKETAEECLTSFQELLNEDNSLKYKLSSNEVIMNDGLIERYFGKLDAEPLATYAYVWPLDMENVLNIELDVESVAAVCHRIRSAVLEIDAQYENKNIVLCSHADVLQITQLYAANFPNVGEFSSYRFGNGEVRKMENYPESLPEASPLELPDENDSLPPHPL